ncbi:hypothetical protein Btru_025078 [Bulinus truncatus]|nr:hypothetical protein Btru_025078 [Bulinus truncatus]
MFKKNGFTGTLLSTYFKSLFSTSDSELGTSCCKRLKDPSSSSNTSLKISPTDSGKKSECHVISLKNENKLSEDFKENEHCNITVNASFPREQEDANTITNRKQIDTGSPPEPQVSSPPEPPVYCCGTGCPNCSWIIYAEDLKRYYENGLDKNKLSAELDEIKDPSVRIERKSSPLQLFAITPEGQEPDKKIPLYR